MYLAHDIKTPLTSVIGYLSLLDEASDMPIEQLVQMTDEFYPLLEPHGKKAVIHADENITIYGDPIKLARVFNNILKNAVAYSDDNSIIDISVEVQKHNVVISFKNKGKTIPKEKLTYIFEEFFRLDEARTTNTGGSGLGLAIAKEIITLHEGTISAENRVHRRSRSVPCQLSSCEWKGIHSSDYRCKWKS